MPTALAAAIAARGKKAKNNLPDPAALAGVLVSIMAHAYPYTRLVVQDSIAAVSGLGG